jgi:hypothetical protein
VKKITCGFCGTGGFSQRTRNRHANECIDRKIKPEAKDKPEKKKE